MTDWSTRRRSTTYPKASDLFERTLITLVTAASAAVLTACGSDDAAAPEQPVPGRYADVNGPYMCYEEHGQPTGQPPVVLLHGALSGISTDFGSLIPELAKRRQAIAVEQQVYGHTADIERLLRSTSMAEDTAALLRQIGVQRADVLGYSMGAVSRWISASAIQTWCESWCGSGGPQTSLVTAALALLAAAALAARFVPVR